MTTSDPSPATASPAPTTFRRSLREPAIAFAAVFALCISWMTVLPLFAGPDEPANFIKSAAVVRGELVGESIDASTTTSFWSTFVDINSQFGTAQQVPWCFVGQPQTPACNKPLSSLSPVENSRTDMGRYPALGFVPAGIGTLVGPSDSGVRAARAGAAVAACALLAFAITMLRRRNRSIAPLLAAATPGVLFLSSVSSPSGLEIAAAIAAWVALWLAVAESWRTTSTISAFVIATSLLMVARPAGIVTVAVMLVAALLANHRALFAAVIAGWRRFIWMIAALAISGAWYVTVYDANFGVQLDVETRISRLSTIIARSLSDLPRLISESVGNFGWLDTPSPTFVVWAFVALSAGLAWRAFSDAGHRERAAIAFVIVAIPLWHIALNRNYQDLLGTFGVQGRHLTPFIVGVPLAAVMRRELRSSDRALVTAFVLLHLWCVLVALRRYSLGAGGDDLLGFIRNPAWAPPLGMILTLVVVGVAHIGAWFGLRSCAGRMER
ncbi:MAG: DUF2142 domain-containing protein [Actinobacteria bacterium]|nr:DUF2142 domain-containing protein [Actinomycetota bacterium]